MRLIYEGADTQTEDSWGGYFLFDDIQPLMNMLKTKYTITSNSNMVKMVSYWEGNKQIFSAHSYFEDCDWLVVNFSKIEEFVEMAIYLGYEVEKASDEDIAATDGLILQESLKYYRNKYFS